jgi:hypothetical protein
MYPHDESYGYTDQQRSVAFGSLRAFGLSLVLRALPRDPDHNETKMPKPGSAQKSVSIRLRMTAQDKAAIEEKARDRALTVTEYLTSAGLGRSARQRADVDTINLLRECADELKAIHATLRGGAVAGGVPSAVTMDQTMQAVCAAINRIWHREGERM